MRMNPEEAVGIVIDVQTRLIPHMSESHDVMAAICRTIRGLRLLNVPLVVTQQYTKGLGPTHGMVQEALGSHDLVEKRCFSCCGRGEFMAHLKSHGSRPYAVLMGMETHVCVLQTALDLFEFGTRPVVVVDAVASRHPLDRQIALDRMKSEGALLTTCESLLFEFLGGADAPAFKAISALVK